MFVKGKSGNPRGRPKEDFEFSALAKSHAPQALEVLVKALGSKIERNRITAANIIIERAYGKPIQEHGGIAPSLVQFTIVLHDDRDTESKSRLNPETEFSISPSYQ